MEKNIQDLLKESNVDGILFTSKQNNFYLTQFKCSFGFTLYTKDKKIFFTDPRYFNNAKKNIDKSFELIELKDKNMEILFSKIEELKIKKLGFEKSYITYGGHQNLKKEIKNVELVEVETSAIRRNKVKFEKDIIKKANDIAKVA
jgi:Xaa-Pro aminopeptidase